MKAPTLPGDRAGPSNAHLQVPSSLGGSAATSQGGELPANAPRKSRSTPLPHLQSSDPARSSSDTERRERAPG